MNGLDNHSSQTMSLSEAIKKSANDMLFNTLLNNPDKRAKVLELLTQEGIVGRDENLSPNSAKTSKYNSPIKRLQKNDSILNLTPKSTNVRMESPSALGRRRALERLESDSSAEDPPQKQTSPQFVGTPKPFDRLLEGVVAYCEIKGSNGEDRSLAINTMMKSMGARIKENLCRGVTHVILKDGLYTTYRKAKLLKVHVVSVLWLEAVKRHKFRVPESKFPAVCADAYEADLTKICQEIQKDYDNVIQEELNKTTEIDSRRQSQTPRNFVTNRKKSIKSRSTIYGSDISAFKEAHNRTEIASPYKYKCYDPDLSESDSYVSVGSVTDKNSDIIPCSQNNPTSLSIYHSKTPELTKVSEEDPDEIYPESNLAKNIKDSFELEKASKIRSPESLLNQSRQKNITTKGKESLEKDESLRLHISTTDESNLNSTGNKSKSNNTSSSRNLLGGITPIINKQSSNLNKKMSSDDASLHLHISEESNSNLPKLNEDNSSKNNIEIPRPVDSISTTSSDVDINKNKTKRRTTVGLKRPTKKDVQLDNSNQTVNSDVSSNTPKIIGIDTSLSSSKTNDSTKNKTQNVVKRNTRRQTIYKITNYEAEDDQPRKSKRRTIAKVNTEKESNSAEMNTVISEEIEKSSKEVEEDNQSTIRKSRRKTVSNVRTETNKKTVVINEDKNTQNQDKNDKPTSSDESVGKVKRRVRKLYDPNQSISVSQINWDDEPAPEPKSISVSPPKKGKYHVPMKELPKILSSKAQNKTKSTIKSTSKSVPAKIPTNFNPDNKNKRKSVRVLNFESTSSETSDTDFSKATNSGVLVTPSRRSERIAKTPAKAGKITEIESVSEETNQSSDNETSDSSIIKRTVTPRIRKSRFISSQETVSSKNNPKNTKKTNNRSQLLQNKIDEETKRRSTLDFIPQRSKKSLERIRLSQKPKPPGRLPTIACTRLHKNDVHIFQQIVKKLGGFVVEDEVTKRTTHLVAGDSARTVNILRAIARGLWIVKQEWLFKSLEANKWLEEEDFELTEFSPSVQKCRLQKQTFGSSYSLDLFKTCGSICISRGCIPRSSDLEELVELCEGRVVRFVKDAKIVVGEHATHEGVTCVNEKWILDSITQNKTMKFKGYLLHTQNRQ